MALVSAAVLTPGDYFAINTPPAVFAKLGIPTVEIKHLADLVGMDIVGRPGGAVSLAVGMASVFANLPGMDRLMAYWYQFIIMFEALFILTTIDAGTRVARYILQDVIGTYIYAPIETSALVARHFCSPASLLPLAGAICSIAATLPAFGRCSAWQTNCLPFWRWLSVPQSS